MRSPSFVSRRVGPAVRASVPQALVAVAITAAVILWCAAGPAAAATPAQINAAVDRGKQYLYEQQKPDGGWEDAPQRLTEEEGGDAAGSQWGGRTSLVVFALLAAGDSPQEPHVARAVQFLLKSKLIGVYAVSLRLQVWSLLPQTAAIRAAAAADAAVLQAGMGRTGQSAGMFSYVRIENDQYDHSCAQYGVLGLWAADGLGVAVPRAGWAAADAAWREHQTVTGGWAYRWSGTTQPDTGERASMTAAGVASLFITQDYLKSYGAAGAACRGNVYDPAIEMGLRWVASHFSPTQIDMYTWFGIERIGVASGLRYFGTLDWYEVGADTLLSTQGGQGGWDYAAGNTPAGTGFALLFLSRGRSPIMMTKVDYSVPAPPEPATEPATKPGTRPAPKPPAPRPGARPARPLTPTSRRSRTSSTPSAPPRPPGAPPRRRRTRRRR